MQATIGGKTRNIELVCHYTKRGKVTDIFGVRYQDDSGQWRQIMLGKENMIPPFNPGRLPRKPMPKSRQKSPGAFISFWAEGNLKNRLKRQADRQGVTLSKAVNDALQEAINDHP